MLPLLAGVALLFATMDTQVRTFFLSLNNVFFFFFFRHRSRRRFRLLLRLSPAQREPIPFPFLLAALIPYRSARLVTC